MSDDGDKEVTLTRKDVWSALMLLRDQATRGQDIEQMRADTIEAMRKALLASKAND